MLIYHTGLQIEIRASIFVAFALKQSGVGRCFSNTKGFEQYYRANKAWTNIYNYFAYAGQELQETPGVNKPPWPKQAKL